MTREYTITAKGEVSSGQKDRAVFLLKRLGLYDVTVEEVPLSLEKLADESLHLGYASKEYVRKVIGSPDSVTTKHNATRLFNALGHGDGLGVWGDETPPVLQDDQLNLDLLAKLIDDEVLGEAPKMRGGLFDLSIEIVRRRLQEVEDSAKQSPESSKDAAERAIDSSKIKDKTWDSAAPKPPKNT